MSGQYFVVIEFDEEEDFLSPGQMATWIQRALYAEAKGDVIVTVYDAALEMISDMYEGRHGDEAARWIP